MKYAILFCLLGSVISYTAISRGAWWYILLWISLSCFALTVAYAGLGSRIFAKRPDGTIPTWIKIIHLPFLLYSTIVWHAIRCLSRENAVDKVTDDLLLARRLLTNEFPEKTINYVDLTAEMEDPLQIRKKVNYISLPILDADVPTPTSLHSAIAKLQPGTTLIHCAQGHGRTGLFALALLAEQGRIKSIAEGMALITKARPGIKLNAHQYRFITKYISNLIELSSTKTT